MCAPVAGLALTAVSTGLQIASGVAQARATRAEGEATNNYYRYLADVNEQQAALAERTGRAQSRAIQDVAKLKWRRLAETQVEFRASQRAALAASGVPLSSVTAEDISRSTISKQALDRATLRFDADTRSYEAITQAANQAYGLRSQASGFRTAGANALTAAKARARGTLFKTGFSALTSAFTPFASSFAIPGFGGYGFGTPLGTRNVVMQSASGNLSNVSILPGQFSKLTRVG